MRPHKNKTLATGLATFLGSVGLHRFYLHGRQDYAGWAHAASLPLSLVFFLVWPTQSSMVAAMPLLLSAMVALGEALFIGLTADEKWDASHNAASGRPSASGWPLAVLLVLAFALGAIAIIAVIARAADLFFTGGAFG